MSRTKHEHEPPALVELLLPLAGLLLVAVFFLPGFRLLLGYFLFFALGLAALSLMLGMALYIRHMKKLAKTGPGYLATSAAAPDTWTMELLGQLEWKCAAELVAAYLQELGYTAGDAEGAVGHQTVLLFKAGRAAPAMLLQCRAWDTGTVDLGSVRELHAAMTTKNVSYGAYYTTGEFSAEAEAFARGKILDLVSGRELLLRLQKLPPVVQSKLLEEATAGDYATPTCPGCEIKMILREAEDQADDAGPAWVCRNRPQCERLIRVPKTRPAA